MTARQKTRKTPSPLAALLAVGFALAPMAPARASMADTPPPASEVTRLSIVGGLASVTQFAKLEQPFWEREITERSGGRIVATIRPFDAGGVRGQEMLQLLRLGVVSYGTVLLSVVSADEPEIDAPDLPLLNPDIETLRRTIAAYRGHMRELLLERYGIVLLGIYTYPAQVIYCKEPFAGLDDLAGRRVRTSAVGQSDLMNSLGAVPVIVPFAEIVSALRADVADCAITGTLSGYEIGLPEVTTHVHSMAISWGVSFFGANGSAWDELPPDLQQIVRDGVGDLETRIWAQAAADTDRGLACNIGASTCEAPPERPMVMVDSAGDEPRRHRLLEEVVLPRWIQRCGAGCAAAWNLYLAPAAGISVGSE